MLYYIQDWYENLIFLKGFFMLQEIYPKIYNPSYFPNKKPLADSYLLYFQHNKILLRKPQPYTIPTFSELYSSNPHIYENAIYVCAIDDTPYFLVEKLDIPEEELYTLEGLQIFRAFYPKEQAMAGVVGSQVYRFLQSRKFCGYCGSPTQLSSTLRALECKKCGALEFPKISPAVIGAVIDRNKDKIILTKNKKSIYSYYALVAGYMEIGETPEEALIREVKEEVGLKIKNIRPYKTQPWPYSDSLMLGFIADLDGDNTIHIQEEELSIAAWFSRKEVPEPEFTISVGHEMMKMFKEGKI